MSGSLRASLNTATTAYQENLGLAQSFLEARGVSEAGAISFRRGAGSDVEAWIPGHEGRYSIRTDGTVLGHRAGGRPYPIAPRRSARQGHLKVTIGWPREHHWVHRLVLEAFVGPAPEGAVARHLNGDPTDNHLENLAWGTQAENCLDTVAHGRSARGERNPRAKLTEETVREIRRLLNRGVPGGRVATEFGISPATVSEIKSGRLWGWLDA